MADSMGLAVVTREEWGAAPPVKIKPLTHPVPYICLSYNNKTDILDKEHIREIQENHIKTVGMYDIQSNFLVTKDGTIYEGRGWYAQPAKMFDQWAKYNGKFIDITIVGQFKGTPKSEDPTVLSIQKLIMFGMENRLISKMYQIIDETKSPTDEV